MTNSNLGLEAINIGSDIEDFYESYRVDDLTDVHQIEKYISKIEDLKRNYRRIHAQLRVEEGEKYPEKYPDFEKQVKELRDNFKLANEKLSTIKNQKGSIDADSERLKLQNETERNLLIDQINWELERYDLDKLESDEIKNVIFSIESKLVEFRKICSTIKGLYGEKFSDEMFSKQDDKIISSIREKINYGHKKITEIKLNNERLVKEKIELEETRRCEQIKIEKQNKINGLIVCAENLLFEIQTRHDIFVTKCDVQFKELNDFELLELKKREENYHTEVREMIDKVSSFEKFVLPCGDAAIDLKKTVTTLRNNCTDKFQKFVADLNAAMASRDVSEKKLQNAAGLKVSLLKFKGYNSQIDIFTFRSEFKKVVEPLVQKWLWADYLKKNLLGGPAHNLVAKVDDIEEIWKKLFEAYGNTQLLLQNKIGSLGKLPNLDKLKDDEKIASTLTSLTNTMMDLVKLAREFDLENELYYGGGLQKVMHLIGSDRERKFIKSIAKENLRNDKKWDKLFDFLARELKEREAYILNEKSKKTFNLHSVKKVENENDKIESNKIHTKGSEGFISGQSSIKCHICGKDENHVISIDKYGKSFIPYVVCKTFVDLNPRDRDRLLFKKRFCTKCLSPGVKWNSEHTCENTYWCGQKYIKKGKELKCEKHVLTCGFHAEEKSNEKLLQKYKENIILPNEKFPDFTRDIKINFFSEIFTNENDDCSSIFAFQTVRLEELQLNIFYDSGCGDLCVTKETVDLLEKKGLAKQEIPGPIILNGVGNQKSVSEYGIYNITLPNTSGHEAKMRGLCVDAITEPFPYYPLEKVEKDFREKLSKQNPRIMKLLPKLPKLVGGKVDIMIGKHYLKYFPREIARLASGLTIYESCFESSDGTKGIISGPHSEFSKTNRAAHLSNKQYNFFVEMYNKSIDLRNSVPFLGASKGSHQIFDPNLDFTHASPMKECVNIQKGPDSKSFLTPCNCLESGAFCLFSGDGEWNAYPNQGKDSTNNMDIYANKRCPKALKIFEEVEECGTNITYRCPKCRNCQDCKGGCKIDNISVQEEIEQDLINKSVTLDIGNKICTAKLPFLADPDLKLTKNLNTARKVYDQQLKRLSKSEVDRNDVIQAEGKLQKLGFVQFLENLNEDDQKMIMDSPVQYYIPWRVVWSKSITTPVRPVFDASHAPYGECSLNQILAKGTNNMNSLIQILIRWRIRLEAFHTDITKMYNAVQLDKAHWRYHLYLWQADLDLNIEPKTKVVKTCIYGVKSSGNQAERAVRLTAESSSIEFPVAYDIAVNDIYVDDCISGKHSRKKVLEATDELKLSLEKGGFTLKGFTFSGEDPDLDLSGGHDYITVAGLKWYPKRDFLTLNWNELNFAQKVRGRKCEILSEVPLNLTMRECVRKLAEIFDPLGRMAPIIASMKLDISHLHRSGLTWDDSLPDNLRSVWVNNFEMMEEIKNIQFRRAVVPIDAKNLDIVTLDTGDASSKLICTAIYARFERKAGTYSCQLVFSRSKVLAEDVSTPRAELMAAHMNASTGHTVKKAFGDLHKRAYKLTDSMVVLHWVSSPRTSLQPWVRNRVIEINRLCDVNDWRHVKSSDMIADLGTRQKVKITDISEGSEWVNGLAWMSLSESEFPAQTIQEVKISKSESIEANKEMIFQKSFNCEFNSNNNQIDQNIKSRYTFSKYLIDPNKYRFRKVVRILALALQFIYKISKNNKRILTSKIFTHKFPYTLPKLLESNRDKFLVTSGLSNSNTLKCAGGKVIELSNFFLKSALFYFSIKTSLEVKHFVKYSKYTNITANIDGVLYYSGRILPDYSFEGYPELCEVAIDLCRTTFCVPVMDQYSPVAISIALEVHWHHPDVQHTGIESMLRQTLAIAYIIEGRKLTKSLKQGCHKCRILNKAAVNALMGPIQNINLCIAPAFVASQLDIFGPYKSFSNVNRRATVKVWFLIFCCCTTGAIDIRLMENYSTDAFILSFIRFSCRFGYPLYLLPDAGSQLIKGCKDMTYSYIDCKQRLSVEYGVQYLPCPVGAHYVHGKVERKIREVKKCVSVNVEGERLSTIQWETLMLQISNSINNLPIGLKTKTEDLENLDILTPNRLILGRNNERCPNSPLLITGNYSKIIEKNADIFKAWFKAWLVSYVPTLIERPKWHTSEKDLKVGDIVLFLKSEKEFEKEYQYGIVHCVKSGRDNKIREVEIEYKNHNELIRRRTKRGVRDLVVIHPVDELSIYERLDHIACE